MMAAEVQPNHRVATFRQTNAGACRVTGQPYTQTYPILSLLAAKSMQ